MCIGGVSSARPLIELQANYNIIPSTSSSEVKHRDNSPVLTHYCKARLITIEQHQNDLLYMQ